MNIESASSSIRQSLKMRKQDAPEGFNASQQLVHSETPDDNSLQRHRLKTVALINLAGMMERMDEQARLLHNLFVAQMISAVTPVGCLQVQSASKAAAPHH